MVEYHSIMAAQYDILHHIYYRIFDDGYIIRK